MLLLRCGSPRLLALRMLSSSSSSSLTLSNPKLYQLPSSSPGPLTVLSGTDACSHNPQRMTMSKCFSATAADPITSSDPLHTHSPEPMESDSQSLVVVSFYKFADFPDHADLRKPLKQLCQDLYVSGGIILAPEGINGSICGTRESVERVLAFIQTDDRLKGLRQIESPVSPEQEAIHHGHSSSSPLSAGEDAPFRWDHVRVKLKKEIVTLGMPDVSPIGKVGKYVSPKDWNALITDPDTVVIDVRNNYEIRIGKFKGAVDPCTKAFHEFPSWVDDQFKPNGANVDQPKLEKEGLNERIDDDAGSPKQKTPKRVAMYCTGGIRCEKASSFMLSKGFDEMTCHFPKTESLWEGECFVFDKPVAVEHGVVQGNFKLCYGCKQPVSDADMEAPEWEYGVSCPYCYSTKSEEEKERARARQRQFESWGIIGGPDKGRRPAVKADSIKSGQNMGDSDTRKIRNICILAHVDHGKTTLADHLIAATGGGLLHPKLAGKLRFMDYLDEEQRRAITMKSSSIALHYKDYEVNLIDSPGHMDFCSEVSTAARLSDGGLVLVDAVEGVHIQTHAVLRQAWIEKVTPCLVLNKIDRLICELKLSPMEAYTRLLRIVLEVNGIMSTYKSEKYLSDVDSILAGPTGEVSDETLESIEDDEEDTFQPQKGNVAFVCALDGWGFTINEFAKFYASKLGANISTLMKAFWGPRYFNPKTKMIVGKKGLGGGSKARPMFVQFVLEPLWQVYQAALEPDGDKGTLEKVIKSFNLSIPPRELQNKDPKIVLQAVMSRWLPLSDAVLSMVVNCMPDPISAQSFRTSRLLPKRELLNKGVDSNVLAEADLVRKSVEACDSSPEAPCVAFVSKMFAVPTKMLPQRGPRGEVLNNFTDEGGIGESDECFLAFARIFSGVLTSGQRVFVLSALYDPLRGESMQKHMQEAELQSLYLMMGQGLKPVTSARAGNIVAIRGLGQHILKTATLSSTKNCWPFSSMAFQVSPTLRVAIEPSDPADMGALMKGLRLLNRADPFVEVTVSSRGEHVLAAAGEVHLERCIKDLKDRFAKVSLEVSPPLVSYKETIEGDLSNALEDLKQFSADSDYVEKITSNGRCTIRVKVIKLPPTLTKVLDESADLLSDIIGGKLGQSGESLEMQSLSLTENESPIEVLRKRIVDALETDFFCGNEKDKDQLEKCKGKWLLLLRRIWALGPRQVGPNILFTPDYKSENDDSTILIHGSPYVSLRLGLADSSSADDIAAITSSELTRPLYGEAESLESSLMSGFQLAAAAGPLCDEPMWGLAFVVEAYISPSTVQAGESELNQQAEQYGLLTGQIMSAVKDACRGAVLQRKPRLVEAMYFCELNTPTEFLGPMYAVLSRRRARVVKEEMQEGSPLFTVHAYVPVSESFGFADELRRWTSGASSALLVLSHWEALPEDPFFVPKTEEEIEEFGDGASVLPNTARKLIDAVRRRKGLPVEEKVVQHATKQRTLARKV